MVVLHIRGKKADVHGRSRNEGGLPCVLFQLFFYDSESFISVFCAHSCCMHESLKNWPSQTTCCFWPDREGVYISDVEMPNRLYWCWLRTSSETTTWGLGHIWVYITLNVNWEAPKLFTSIRAGFLELSCVSLGTLLPGSSWRAYLHRTHTVWI